MISILATVARQERVRLAERTRAGLDRVRREGKRLGRPTAKVEDWLLQELRPYRELSSDQIEAAAERGDFRDLGLRCRNALAREVQRRKRQPRYKEIALDPPADEEGHRPGLLHLLGTDRPDLQSSLAQEVSLEERMQVGGRVLNLAIDYAVEFARLDLLHGLLACGRALETHWRSIIHAARLQSAIYKEYLRYPWSKVDQSPTV